MARLYFASLLEKEFLERLEQLMFFNPQQGIVSPDIIRSMERFGEPAIIVEGDYLIVKIGDFPDAQTLFALFDDGEIVVLAGILIYIRTSIKELYVLQIAVREEWSISGKYADYNLLPKMIGRLREIAQRLRGVGAIIFSYGGKDVILPIHKTHNEV